MSEGSLTDPQAYPKPWSDVSPHMLSPCELPMPRKGPSLPDLLSTTPEKEKEKQSKPVFKWKLSLTSTSANDYPEEQLKAMSKPELNRLSFADCPINIIDKIFKKQEHHGQIDPPEKYRKSAAMLRAWRRMGRKDQQFELNKASCLTALC